MKKGRRILSYPSRNSIGPEDLVSGRVLRDRYDRILRPFFILKKFDQKKPGKNWPGRNQDPSYFWSNYEERPEDTIVSIAQYSPRYEILWSDTEGHPLTVNSTRIWIRPYLSHFRALGRFLTGFFHFRIPDFYPPGPPNASTLLLATGIDPPTKQVEVTTRNHSTTVTRSELDSVVGGSIPVASNKVLVFKYHSILNEWNI